MANGKAGNYKISCEDTEFSKFTFSLRKALLEICRRLSADCDKQGRAFTCKVTGAKSQQTARAMAKNIVSAERIRRAILHGEQDMESILYLVNGATDNGDYTKLQITLDGAEKSIVLYEDQTIMRIDKPHLLGLLEGKEITLKISLNDGNYGATALGCLELKEISL
jgi:glutamate N-acetyltransferase/amino-acid N-acetyltransferase